MKPEVVYTKAAPKTGFSEGMESPIAQGVKCGQFLFVSGQGPLDPATKEVVSPDLAEQTRVTLDNMRAVLEAGGTSIENVVKVGVFLRSMDDFPVVQSRVQGIFQGSAAGAHDRGGRGPAQGRQRGDRLHRVHSVTFTLSLQGRGAG